MTEALVWAGIRLALILGACWLIEQYVGRTLARGWSTRRIVVTFVLIFIGPMLIGLEFYR